MQKKLFTPPIGKISPFFVALAFVPWLLILYVIVSNYVVGITPNDKDIIQKFIEWFGTAYSLFLALVLGYVWTQFDNLDREFDLEADALAALHQTSSYISTIVSTERTELSKEQKLKTIGYVNDIERGIIAYVKHVIEYYQNEYSDANAYQREKGEKLLDGIGEKISLITYDKSTPDTLVSELFLKLNEAMDTRGDRIAHSKQRMPSAVWWVALVSSLVWLVPFLGLIIDDGYVFLLLVGGAAFVIIMVLTIVNDLDDPFNGAWKVNINSWYQFLETLEPTLIFVYNTNNTFFEREIQTLIGRWFKFKVCSLRYLTYQHRLEKSAWRELRRVLEDEENIVIKELFANQYSQDARYKAMGVSEFPVVILYRSHADFHVLLKRLEIDSCDNLTTLKDLLRQKLRLISSSTVG